MLFQISSCFLTYFYLQNKLFIEFMGTMSAVLEGCIALPQVHKNFVSKNVVGLSFALVFTWFAGDFMKLCYFVSYAQPVQFTLCAAF
jgi:uncharacterized protein with PQ loop repeat